GRMRKPRIHLARDRARLDLGAGQGVAAGQTHQLVERGLALESAVARAAAVEAAIEVDECGDAHAALRGEDQEEEDDRADPERGGGCDCPAWHADNLAQNGPNRALATRGVSMSGSGRERPSPVAGAPRARIASRPVADP